MKKVLLVIFFLLFSFAHRAKAEISNVSGIWPQTTVKIKLSDESRLILGSSPRVNDNFRSFDQHLFISDFIYDFNEHWSGLFGYRWLTSYPGDFTNQHWLDQGVLYRHKLKVSENRSISFVHRAMIEERFITDLDVYSTRFRYLLSAKMPITKSKKLSWLSFNEFFVNLNETVRGPQQGVDRNRFFTGLDYAFNKQVSVQAGYQLEYVNLGADKRFEHLLTTNLVFSI
ncbi:MAG: DUF2490 domain-containing protein [Candidatus Caenarcaniphilales bacterium]|nr:DUF2490 domain-containing protein [Candidatus Caenarcaniphilales bacterium]